MVISGSIRWRAVTSGRVTPRGDGTLLPDPLDLIQSKLDTGRDKDLQYSQHLESVVRADYKLRLLTASLWRWAIRFPKRFWKAASCRKVSRARPPPSLRREWR